MARKKKKLNKTQRHKIYMKNLRKAWAANRRKKRRRNPKKRSKRKVRRKRKNSRKKSRRKRNPARIGSLMSARSCLTRNPGVVDSLTEMELDYAYTKPNPGCDCLNCPEHAHLIRRNPGWTFKKGRVIPHDQEFSEMYQKSAFLPGRRTRHRPRRRYNPRMEGVLRAGSCRRRFNPRMEGILRAGSCLRNPTTTCSNCGKGNRPGKEICWSCGFDLAATPEARIAATRRRAMGGMDW